LGLEAPRMLVRDLSKDEYTVLVAETRKETRWQLASQRCASITVSERYGIHVVAQMEG
jgi:hypothetical protein